MKLTLFCISLSVIIFFSCQKRIDDGKIFGEHVQSDLTMAERVYAFKNTGKYSDTSAIARSGYGIVMHGNSIVERMLYYSWKTSWVDKGYPILNRGIGGTTWNEKIPYIKDLVSVYRPNDIVLYDGENEFLRAASGDLSVATKLLTSFVTVREVDKRVVTALGRGLKNVIAQGWRVGALRVHPLLFILARVIGPRDPFGEFRETQDLSLLLHLEPPHSHAV